MSRSYKKPYITDQNKGKPQYGEAKRRAARRARKTNDLASGGAYKKEFNSWDIRDWSFHSPKDKKAYRK